MTEAMIFPIILAFRLLVISGVIYVGIRAMRTASPAVRRASLILLIAGLIAIEIFLRATGSRPYFAVRTSFESAITQIVRVDQLTTSQIMICDSYGVNRLLPSGAHHTETLLNREGFRSLHEFTATSIDSIHAQGRQAIMLIGDSYTYGMNADSGRSFAALLESSGRYGVLNAGIPGTDIPQYLAVIHEYISDRHLRPDMVVVCINGANDLRPEPQRRLTPGVPLLYTTNVGGLYSHQSGTGADTVYPDARSAYQHILYRYTIVGVMGEGMLTDLISHSRLLSHLLGIFIPQGPYLRSEGKDQIGYRQAADDISRMRAMCDSAQVPVVFALLPGKQYVKDKKPFALIGAVPIDPQLFSLSDYTEGFDDHPNNSGHRKLADALDKIIAPLLPSPRSEAATHQIKNAK